MIERMKEIIRYKQMLISLTQSDLRTRYKGSILGFLWTFINPLLMLGIYTLIFSTVMRIDMDNYSIFLFVGLLPWIFFQTSILNGAGVIIRNANLVKKIYFPREVLPLSTVLGALVNYLFSLLILIPFLIVYQLPFLKVIYYLPLILLIQFILTLGITFLVSSVNVYFRDIEHVLGIVTMAWFYFTPIIYPSTMIPKEYLFYFNINPMKPIIEAYQLIFYYGKAPEIFSLLTILVVSLVFLSLSWLIFMKLNRRFAEEV